MYIKDWLKSLDSEDVRRIGERFMNEVDDDETKDQLIERIVAFYQGFDNLFMRLMTSDREKELLEKIAHEKEITGDAIILALDIKRLKDKLIIDEEGKFFLDHKVVDEAFDPSFTQLEGIAQYALGIIKARGYIKEAELIEILGAYLKKPASSIKEELMSSFIFFTSVYLDGDDDVIYYQRPELVKMIKEKRVDVKGAGEDLELFRQLYTDGFPSELMATKRFKEHFKDRDILHYGDLVEYARVTFDLSNLHRLDDEDKKMCLDLVYALPSPIYSGLSYDMYQKGEVYKAYIIEKVQNAKANLSPKDAVRFLSLYNGLSHFVNENYHVTDVDLEPILYDIRDLNKAMKEALIKVGRFIYERPNVIDSFINENPFKYKRQERTDVLGFKKIKYNSVFAIVGFNKDHTLVADPSNKKIYPVKGLYWKLEDLLDDNRLPIYIETVLVEYRGQITYNGVLFIDHSFDDEYIQKEFMKNLSTYSFQDHL